MKKIDILVALIFCLTTIFSFAQNNTTTVQYSVKDLSFMAGTWEGEGWTTTREGRVFSEIIEKVGYKLDSSILVVEGLGTKTDSITKEVKVVHNAFGVIFVNLSSNALNIRAYKEGGGVTTSEIAFIEEKVIRWNMDLPNGSKVRFTVDFKTTNKWIEIGEFSRDGVNWVNFLSMELRKKE